MLTSAAKVVLGLLRRDETSIHGAATRSEGLSAGMVLRDPSGRPVVDYFESLTETSGLPAELVVQILDLAELWYSVGVTVCTEVPFCVHSRRQIACSTPALTEAGAKSLRRVIFNIEAKDQGWSSSGRQFHGTYDASWTWFEALVVNKQPAGDILDEDQHPRKELQRNRHAGKQYETYRITLEHSVPIFREITDRSEICLLACARFNGWANHVKHASIEMQFASTFDDQENSNHLFYKRRTRRSSTQTQ